MRPSWTRYHPDSGGQWVLTVPSQSSLKHAFYGILALVSLLGLGITQSARADFIATINQVGTNVVVTGSGTIDLFALAFQFNAQARAGMTPSNGELSIGSPSFENVAIYSGFSGPTGFGGGGTFIQPGSGSGDKVDIINSANWLIVPLGYMSGQALLDNSTYTGMTFASLGVTPGTYVWTWGTGDHADSFTIQVGPAGVPDGGSTLSLLGLASLGLVALRRKLGC